MKEDLQKDYKQKVALTNLAVSGAKMPDLLKQIESNGAQYSIKQADVIVLTIEEMIYFRAGNRLER